VDHANTDQARLGVGRSVGVMLVSWCLAGCGAQPQPVVRVTPPPQAVHIQRSIRAWLTNGGRTPPPSAVDITRTDRARGTPYFAHVRGPPTYTVPVNAVFFCPISYGQVVTLIRFLAGTTVVFRGENRASWMRVDIGTGRSAEYVPADRLDVYPRARRPDGQSYLSHCAGFLFASPTDACWAGFLAYRSLGQ
jgi:hypothetical protein